MTLDDANCRNWWRFVLVHRPGNRTFSWTDERRVASTLTGRWRWRCQATSRRVGCSSSTHYTPAPHTHTHTHTHTHSATDNILTYISTAAYCSILFFSRPRSEGRPHHARTLSILLSFWLTLPRRILSTSWCCPSRPRVVVLACVHLALFLALSLSQRNSHVSSRLYILLLAVSSLFIYLLIYFFYF